MLQLSVARTLEAAEALCAPWDALCDACPTATPFQRPAWLLAWVRAMRVEALRVVAVRCGRDLVGLAPLFSWGAAPERTLSLLGAAVSDHLDVLAASGVERGVADALGAWLEDERNGWDACALDEVGPRATLRRIAAPSGTRVAVTPQSVCPVLALPRGGAGVESIVPRRLAAKLRKDRKHAERLGAVSFERADRGDAREALRTLFALHEKRWGSAGRPGVVQDARVRALHEQAAPAFAARSALRLYLLRIGGRCAAVVYGMRERQRLHLYLQGIDPDLERASPGSVLLREVLDDALREGVAEVDFLRGGEAYKYAWGAVDEPNDRLRIERG
jgi:CelD/BcsL family acetyltransferase involved in cellulose biosynthesis